MASGSIINEILRGVIPAQDNHALEYLGQMLGTMLVEGAANAPAITILAKLSVYINVVFWACLVIIIAYMAVGGVVQTATHGKFLGSWGNKPMMMLMFCVIALSPIPSKNGVTVIQYAYVKGLIFGSNLADYTLKKAFETNAEVATMEYNQKGQFLQQLNTQMKTVLPNYFCGIQLTQMGYGVRPDYFKLLGDICAIPGDAQSLFIPYYLPGKPQYTQQQRDKVNQINAAYGTNILPPQGYDIKKILEANSDAKRTVVSKEMMCYFNVFARHFHNEVPRSVAAELKMPVSPPALKMLPLVPETINTSPIDIREAALSATWGYALKEAYLCVMPLLSGQVQEKYVKSLSGQAPWRHGWTQAGMSIQDELNNYTEATKKSALPLATNFGRPNPELLESSMLDRQNSATLQSGMAVLSTILNGTNTKIDRVADSLAGKLTAQADSSTNFTMERMIATAVSGVVAPTETKKDPLRDGVAALTETKKDPRRGLTSFLDSFVGKSSTITGTSGRATFEAGREKFGAMTRKAGVVFSKLDLLHSGLEKSKRAMEGVSKSISSIPVVGTLLSSGAEVAKALLLPSELKLAIVGATIFGLNILVLLPQVVLLVVMLLWLARAVMWFLILPMGAVVMALPGTRAGHDIWKTALAICLTPFLATLCFLLGIFINDIMYTAVLSWMFAPVLQGDLLSGIGNMILMLATGEFIFRFVVAFLVVCAVTVFLGLLILRGPDRICAQLGLSGSSGDLGDEFETLRGKMLKNPFK